MGGAWARRMGQGHFLGSRPLCVSCIHWTWAVNCNCSKGHSRKFIGRKFNLGYKKRRHCCRWFIATEEFFETRLCCSRLQRPMTAGTLTIREWPLRDGLRVGLTISTRFRRATNRISDREPICREINFVSIGSQNCDGACREAPRQPPEAPLDQAAAPRHSDFDSLVESFG
jgi:hypothetical protein